MIVHLDNTRTVEQRLATVDTAVHDLLVNLESLTLAPVITTLTFNNAIEVQVLKACSPAVRERYVTQRPTTLQGLMDLGGLPYSAISHLLHIQRNRSILEDIKKRLSPPKAPAVSLRQALEERLQSHVTMDAPWDETEGYNEWEVTAYCTNHVGKGLTRLAACNDLLKQMGQQPL